LVNLFCGPNGSGKTQKLIDHANEELSKTQGLIVFIDKSDKRRQRVNSQIKFVNTKEFSLDAPDAFYGFICGIISGNYDINRVYTDNLADIIRADSEEECKAFISKINAISENYQVEFYFTLTTPPEDTTRVTELVFNG